MSHDPSQATPALHPSCTVRIALTDSRLDGMDAPSVGRAWVYDTTMPGLAVMLTAAGGRTFYLVSQINGKSIRARVGAWPTLTAEAARKAARTLAGQIAAGVDVLAQRRSERDRKAKERAQDKQHALPTMEGVWLAWNKERSPQLRTLTVRTYDLRWRIALRAWAAKPLDAITGADAANLFNVTAQDHGRVSANRLRSLGRMLWHWSQRRWQHNLPDPWQGVRPYEESARNRTLTPDELTRILRSCATEQPTPRDMLRMLLWTGQRIGNVRMARWSDIDTGTGVWTIPPYRAKGRRAVVIPLPTEAVTMLRARRLANPSGEWVFPSDLRAGPWSHVRGPWRRVCKHAGVVNATRHDVRRGFASAMTAAGVSLSLVSRLLGHSSVAITEQRYVRLGADDVRVHVDALAARLAASALLPDPTGVQAPTASKNAVGG